MPLLPAYSLPAPAPSGLLGVWTTQRNNMIEIFACQTQLCLRIARVDPREGHATDGLNPDASKRGRSLCGLVIGSGFTPRDGKLADGGKLYDPESGNTYSGTITLTGGSTLKLRGYIGISLLGRTETWTRAETPPPACPAG